MNITGGLDLNSDRNIFNGNPQGAFFREGSGGKTWAAMSSNTNALGDIRFDASRSWTGLTSTVDNHQHTTQDAGSGQSHNNMQPYLAVAIWKRTA